MGLHFFTDIQGEAGSGDTQTQTASTTGSGIEEYMMMVSKCAEVSRILSSNAQTTSNCNFIAAEVEYYANLQGLEEQEQVPRNLQTQ